MVNFYVENAANFLLPTQFDQILKISALMGIFLAAIIRLPNILFAILKKMSMSVP